MSPLGLRDSIAKLSADVRRLRLELVIAEQAVNELLDGEDGAAMASGRADALRALLHAALERHHDETEELLAETCSVHGSAILVSCPDCVRRLPKRAA
jgi:hypothetical protein